jgi:hypothetical protein
MTKDQLLVALSNGEKITNKQWKSSEYILLKDGIYIDEHGNDVSNTVIRTLMQVAANPDMASNIVIWTKPSLVTKSVKVAPYLIWGNKSQVGQQTLAYYATDKDFEHSLSDLKFIRYKRVMALEIEIDVDAEVYPHQQETSI